MFCILHFDKINPYQQYSVLSWGRPLQLKVWSQQLYVQHQLPKTRSQSKMKHSHAFTLAKLLTGDDCCIEMQCIYYTLFFMQCGICGFKAPFVKGSLLSSRCGAYRTSHWAGVGLLYFTVMVINKEWTSWAANCAFATFCFMILQVWYRKKETGNHVTH